MSQCDPRDVAVPSAVSVSEQPTATLEDVMKWTDAARLTVAQWGFHGWQEVVDAVNALSDVARRGVAAPSATSLRWALRNDPTSHAAYSFGRSEAADEITDLRSRLHTSESRVAELEERWGKDAGVFAEVAHECADLGDHLDTAHAEITTLRAANVSLAARSAALEEEREALKAAAQAMIEAVEWADRIGGMGQQRHDVLMTKATDLRAALSTPATPDSTETDA